MSKIMTAKEFQIQKWKENKQVSEIEMLNLYGRYVRDTTLEVAAEKAEWDIGGDGTINVDKDSILSLKDSEDLKI